MGLLALTVASIASSSSAELIIWMKPIAASDAANVDIFNTYDSGGTSTANAGLGSVGNLGVHIKAIPATPQTITFKLIATVHGTDLVATNDQMGSAVFDILNSAWTGSAASGLAIGRPSPVTLTAALGAVGSATGALAATDLTGDAAPDIGGPFDVAAVPGPTGPYVKPYSATGNSTDGQISSTVDARYTNLDIGTFTYTYDNTNQLGTAAQLAIKTMYTALTGANFLATWRQDNTGAAGSKKDYSGYKGTNCQAGPAVPIKFGEFMPPVGALFVVKGQADGVGLTIDLGRVMQGATLTAQNVTINNAGVGPGDFTATVAGAATVTPAGGANVAVGADVPLSLNINTAAAGDFTANSFVTVHNGGNAADVDEKLNIKATVVAKRNIANPAEQTVNPPGGSAGFLKGTPISGTVSIAGGSLVTNPTVGTVATGGAVQTGANAVNVPWKAVLNGDSVQVTLPVAPEFAAGTASGNAEGAYANVVFTARSAVAGVGIGAPAASNQSTTLGAKLGAAIPANGAITDVGSSVLANPTATPQPVLGTTATVREGSVGAAGDNVTMAWRARDASKSELANLPVTRPDGRVRPAYLISDVVDLTTGTAVANRVPAFALEMTYDETKLAAGTEAAQVASGYIFVAYSDNGTWKHATIEPGATSSADTYRPNMSWAAFRAANTQALSTYLGYWGVDPVSNTAWVVTDHNSLFAVVPEPGTIGLLVTAGLGLALVYLRRRKA
jgi:hypothetical protein